MVSGGVCLPVALAVAAAMAPVADLRLCVTGFPYTTVVVSFRVSTRHYRFLPFNAETLDRQKGTKDGGQGRETKVPWSGDSACCWNWE